MFPNQYSSSVNAFFCLWVGKPRRSLSPPSHSLFAPEPFSSLFLQHQPSSTHAQTLFVSLPLIRAATPQYHNKLWIRLLFEYISHPVYLHRLTRSIRALPPHNKTCLSIQTHHKDHRNHVKLSLWSSSLRASHFVPSRALSQPPRPIPPRSAHLLCSKRPPSTTIQSSKEPKSHS